MDRSNKKKSKILYKCITANTSVIWQHAAHTTDQLSSPNRYTGAIQKSLSLNEKYWRIFWKKCRRKGQQAENDKTERVTGLGRRTRGDSKVESNDSPEIPDRGETSDIPSLPSGAGQQTVQAKQQYKIQWSTTAGKHFCPPPPPSWNMLILIFLQVGNLENTTGK